MPEALRCALLVGTLQAGGAEKQMLYMARALLAAGVDVRIYYLTWDDAYGAPLRRLGLPLIPFNSVSGAPLRTLALLNLLRAFRPHVIQATHTYTNLYAALTALPLGSISLGALRSNLQHAYTQTGRWTPWLLRLPHGLVVNSRTAVQELIDHRLSTPERLHLLLNVIDLAQFDALARQNEGEALPPFNGLTAMLVARLIPAKRIDVFIRAVTLARQRVPGIRGVIVGDGMERENAARLAGELGLLPDGLLLLGERRDVPALLRHADALVLCSDDEGFSNVLLEGMAAGLPIVATPAGDSAAVVQAGATGSLVPFGDAEALAAALIDLAEQPERRQRWGEAGRARVEAHYSDAHLAARLGAIYRLTAEQRGSRRLLNTLNGW